MAKNKENPAEIRKLEKKIKSWENLKSYPDLDEIYQLAYIIELNPGELLALRNRGRKQFFRDSNEPKDRHDWVEISDNFAIYGSGFMKMFGVIGAAIFLIFISKAVDLFYGDSAERIEEEIIVRQIKEHTEENYVPEDFGSVQNFLDESRKDDYNQRIENIKINTGYYKEHPEEKPNINNTTNTLN